LHLISHGSAFQSSMKVSEVL